MRLDLYQQETAAIAGYQSAILAEARAALSSGRALTPLEQNGVLHALQVLIENAIGKAKHWLKAVNQPVPVSAYDAFQSLAQLGYITSEEIKEWNNAIGLRNRIVHDYMNIRMDIVLELVLAERFRFIVEFLQSPMVD
jgi:uncharacterized protein YutE (UPF0331/DUF86 family)